MKSSLLFSSLLTSLISLYLYDPLLFLFFLISLYLFYALIFTSLITTLFLSHPFLFISPFISSILFSSLYISFYLFYFFSSSYLYSSHLLLSSLPSFPQSFWDVVSSMTAEEQGELLQFVTSCPRQPLRGFGQLNPLICVQVRNFLNIFLLSHFIIRSISLSYFPLLLLSFSLLISSHPPYLSYPSLISSLLTFLYFFLSFFPYLPLFLSVFLFHSFFLSFDLSLSLTHTSTHTHRNALSLPLSFSRTHFLSHLLSNVMIPLSLNFMYTYRN